MENIKRNFSLDIETVSLAPNAFIISIGCVEFNILTGEVYDNFHQIVDIHSTVPGSFESRWLNTEHNARLKLDYCDRFDVDDDTVDWWLDINPDYFNSLIESSDARSLKDVLKRLEEFIGYEKNDMHIWTVGNLDPAAIENAYITVTKKNPFTNLKGCWREIRTLEQSLEGIISRDDVPMEAGIKHNALDDATVQAKQVSMFYNKLNDIKELYLFRFGRDF